MKVIIAGGGANGCKLIDLFKDYSNDKLTVIEKESSNCELISESYPGINIVWGDATNTDVLEEAEVATADVFIAITGDDHMNLLSAKAAKKMGVPEVVVKIVESQHKKLAELMGLENVIDPVDAISAQVITQLTGVDIAELIHELHLDIDLKKWKISENPELIGEYIFDLAKITDENVYPVIVIRDNEYYLPSNIKEMKEGDIIVSWKQKNNEKFFDLA